VAFSARTQRTLGRRRVARRVSGEPIVRRVLLQLEGEVGRRVAVCVASAGVGSRRQQKLDALIRTSGRGPMQREAITVGISFVGIGLVCDEALHLIALPQAAVEGELIQALEDTLHIGPPSQPMPRSPSPMPSPPAPSPSKLRPARAQARAHQHPSATPTPSFQRAI